MSGFSAQWLALREPADRAARNAAVTRAVTGAWPTASSLRVVDLGSGTGSNVRYLAPHVPEARWRLVDNDEHLLQAASRMLRSVPRTPGDGEPAADVSEKMSLETRVANLLELDSTIIGDHDLVTASALLDLVSETWLVRLITLCRAQGSRVLFALNYDGRMSFEPAEPLDADVRAWVNAHQRTDKGFGPALGPDAGARAETLLRSAGYDVQVGQSDWVLGDEHGELQRQLVRGWADAAEQIEPDRAGQIRDWAMRRIGHVDAGRSRIVVGHLDVGGVPRSGNASD